MTLTYARIFTNSKTAEAYLHIFDTLAEVIREHTNSYPTWRHIHGEGWAYVLADMDSAQAKGLGMHLNRIDSTKTSEEHLQHVLISCLVHFHRALQQKKFSDEIKKLMTKIPYVEDETYLNETMDKLKAHPDKGSRNGSNSTRNHGCLHLSPLFVQKFRYKFLSIPHVRQTQASQTMLTPIGAEDK